MSLYLRWGLLQDGGDSPNVCVVREVLLLLLVPSLIVPHLMTRSEGILGTVFKPLR